MTFIPHVIDGQESESASGARFASVDPWTREPYAEVALGGAEDADRAVRAARRAFDEGPWPRMGFAERGALLHRFADLIEANADDARAGRHHRHGQADQRRPHPGRAADRGQLPLLRRPRPAGHRRCPADGHRPPRVHPVRACGRGRRRRAVELPAHARVLEGRTGPGLGQHRGAQAGRGHPGVRHDHGPAGPGGRPAARRPQRPARLRPGLGRRRADRASRASTGSRSPASPAPAGSSPARPRPTWSRSAWNSAARAPTSSSTTPPWTTRSTGRSGPSSATPARSAWPARGCTSSAASTTSSSTASWPPPQALVVGDPKDPATQLGPLASEEHYKKVRSYLDGIEADGGTIRTGGPGDGWVVLPTDRRERPAHRARLPRGGLRPGRHVTAFDTDEEASPGQRHAATA